LVPKPKDWGPYIDLANFIEDEQAHTYEPPQACSTSSLRARHRSTSGFGSVVAEDPCALTRTIFTALDRAGARGIVSEGWAHLGGEAPPPNVYVIGDCPHDWLFPRCRASAITAAPDDGGGPARRAAHGRGAVLRRSVLLGAHRRGCGRRTRADSIRRLDSELLTAAFDACRRPQIRERASELGARLRATDGVTLARNQ